MLPTDLPPVALAGTPYRLGRGDVPGGGSGDHWEWLGVRLQDGGEVAVFDPDHLCPPGYFGHPCRLGIELFHPTVLPAVPGERTPTLIATSSRPTPEAPPAATGMVVAHHRHEWRYTGPVTTLEEVDGAPRRTVRHVVDAPQVTVRLVVELGSGLILAQLRDPSEVPPAGAWVTLRDGRAELVSVERAS